VYHSPHYHRKRFCRGGGGLISQGQLLGHLYFPFKLYRLLLVYKLLGGGGLQLPPWLLWPCSLIALFHHAMTSYYVSIYTPLLNRQNVVNFPSILFCNQFNKFQKFAFQNGHLLAEKVITGAPQLKNIGLVGHFITLELSREI
jgi:hypothetical protein